MSEFTELPKLTLVFVLLLSGCTSGDDVAIVRASLNAVTMACAVVFSGWNQRLLDPAPAAEWKP